MDETSFKDYYRYYKIQSGSGYEHPGIATYRGPVYQRGGGLGSLFASLIRSITPLFSSGLKHVGKELLSSGLHLGSDVLAGKKFSHSLQQRAKESGANLMESAASKLRGSGIKRKRKRRSKSAKKNIKKRNSGRRKTVLKNIKKKKVIKKKKRRVKRKSNKFKSVHDIFN